MMVTGLQTPLQSLPLDGMLGKPQPAESETIQPLTFGEILKLKEKQLQQEQQVSAASIAAALMALQTQPMILPSLIPNLEVSDSQPAVDGSSQTAATSAVTSSSSSATQSTTTRLRTTEVSAPVPQTFSTAESAATPPQTESTETQSTQVAITGSSTATAAFTKMDASKTLTDLRSASDTAQVTTKPIAANDVSKGIVDQTVFGHVAPQATSSAPSVLVEPQYYSPTTAKTSQPTTAPKPEITPKVRITTQEAAAQPKPQATVTPLRGEMAPLITAQPAASTVEANSALVVTDQGTSTSASQSLDVPEPVIKETQLPSAGKTESETVRAQTTQFASTSTPVHLESKENEPAAESQLHGSTAPTVDQPPTARTMESAELESNSLSETVSPKLQVNASDETQTNSPGTFIKEETPTQAVDDPFVAPLRSAPENSEGVQAKTSTPTAEENPQTISTSSKVDSQPVRAETEIKAPAPKMELTSSPVATSQPETTVAHDGASFEALETTFTSQLGIPVTVTKSASQPERGKLAQTTSKEPETSFAATTPDASEPTLAKPAAHADVVVKADKQQETQGVAATSTPVSGKVEAKVVDRVNVSKKNEPNLKIDQPAQNVTGHTIRQVNENVAPDANAVAETFDTPKNESVAEDTSRVADMKQFSDDKPRSVRAIMSDDDQAIKTDTKVVEEYPVSEREVAVFASNTDVVEKKPVVVPSVHAEEFQARPVENTTASIAEPVVLGPNATVTRTVARSSNTLSDVAEGMALTEQPASDAQTTEVKAEAAQLNVEQGNSAAETEETTPNSLNASIEPDKAVFAGTNAMKAETKPVTFAHMRPELSQIDTTMSEMSVAVETKNVEKQTESQAETTLTKDDLQTAHSDVTKNSRPQPASSGNVSKNYLDEIEMQPAKTAARMVDAEVQEKPVSVDKPSAADTHIVNEPVRTKKDDTVDVKAADPKPVSIERKEKTEPVVTKEPVTSDSSVSTKPVVQVESKDGSNVSTVEKYAPVVEQTPVATKPALQAEPKEEIKIRQATSKDEETRPAEKRIEPNQTLGSTVPATGLVNEAKTADFNGKVSMGQVNAQASEVVQQVIRQMNGRIKAGATSMHLQLNPKELGAIEVDMVSSPQGLHVTFFAEQASTGRLLETQLNQLRDSLVDSGVQLSGLNIGQHNTQGQKGGGFSQESNAAPWPNEIFVEENRTGATETTTAERRFGQSSDVDYRV